MSPKKRRHEDESLSEQEQEREHEHEREHGQDAADSCPKTVDKDRARWSPEILDELISRIRAQIPPEDRLCYTSRLHKISWDEVKFDEYSAEDVWQMWTSLKRRVRCFRTLPEILADLERFLRTPPELSDARTHPDFPPKPRKAFAIFLRKMKPKVERENPGAKNTAVFGILTGRFGELSDEKKEKYKRRAAVERAEYEAKLEEFYRTHPEFRKEIEKKVPRKRIVPFRMFLEDYVENNLSQKERGERSMKDISAVARRKWDELTDEDKLTWLERAKKDAALQFEADPQNMDIVPDNLILNKKEKKIIQMARDIHHGLPKKPPKSLFSYFTSKAFESGEIKGRQQWMQILSEKWKALSADDKEKLNVEFQEKIQDYKQKYKQYFESMDLSNGSEKNPDMTEKKTNKRKKEQTEIGEGSQVVKKKRKEKKLVQEATISLERTKKDEVQEDLSANSSLHKKKKTKTSTKEEDQNEHAKKKKYSQEEIDEYLKNKPKTPPDDVMAYYARLMKKNKIKVKSEEELSTAWETLSKKERKEIKKQFKAVQEQYALDYQNFLASLPPKILLRFANQT